MSDENIVAKYGQETIRQLGIALGKDPSKLTEKEIEAGIKAKHIQPHMRVSPGVIRKRRMRRAGVV